VQTLYAGFGTYLYMFTYSGLTDKTQTRFYMPVFVGYRRPIYKNLGAFAELGFNDMGFFKCGLTMKFNQNSTTKKK
jgi:hypothetical protein